METIEASRPSDMEQLFAHIQRKGVEFDTEYSYEELEGIVGKPRNSLHSLIVRINRKLGKSHHRYLKNVPNQGWRVARPEEHVELGHEHIDRATRQVKRAVQVVAHADATAMTPAQRNRNDLTLSGLRAMQRQVQDNSTRIKRLEGLQTQQVQVLSEHDTRLADIERQINELKNLKGE